MPPRLERCARRHRGKMPLDNPFATMGLKSSTKLTPTATFEELQAFRAKAKEMGMPLLATAARIGWDWLQREVDIFATFDVRHYRPKERPDLAQVVHHKTGKDVWMPLFDEHRLPLFPELMAELDAIKRERIGGLMLQRDWGDRRPWPTWRADLVDLSSVGINVKKIIRAAGLRDELTFTSFRHGGTTNGADAGLSDAEIRALTGHRSAKVLPRYAKRTMTQVISAIQEATGDTNERGCERNVKICRNAGPLLLKREIGNGASA